MNEPTPTIKMDTKTKKKRIISPEVLAIKAEAAAKIKAHHESIASVALQARIINKYLPRLTSNQREEIFNQLSAEFTLPLPGVA